MQQLTFEQAFAQLVAVGSVIEVWDGWSAPEPKYHPGDVFWHRAKVVRAPVEVIDTTGDHRGQLVNMFYAEIEASTWPLNYSKVIKLVEDEGRWWRWPTVR